MTSSTPTSSDCTSISAVNRDIIETHILTKLDGPTLASTVCASPMLHALCNQQKLWKDMCTSTWGSINDPIVSNVISTFPAGYRSFFSDSFPTTLHRRLNAMELDQSLSLPTSELISAVDIRYKNRIVCSKVQVTETVINDFLAPRLWIDLLPRKETEKFKADNNEFLSDLVESVSLSWILIDPSRKRSVNLGSQRPVLVEWLLPEEVQLLYVTVLPGNSRVGSTDPVQCWITVTCGGEEGGEMHVREVNMQVQDMDGVNLSGEDSLVILQEAMGCERRKEVKERERYEEFLEMKRERRDKKEKREKRLDLFCKILGLFIFVILLCLLFGHKY